MEIGTIERELRIEASPEVVYEVLSRPEHLREWWPDEADLQAVAGTTGTIAFERPQGRKVQAVTVVEADPPRRFSFRWVHEEHEAAVQGNSLLVTFDLLPSGQGTLLRFRETGFRELGWEVAMLEQQYLDHVAGWDHFLPRLRTYVAGLGSGS
jgi:uncharacterized protein YndB with AHSA1/START domain